MRIELPPSADGQRNIVENDSQRLVIVGANGAGKSRFAAKLATDLGDEAFRMSALTALFDRRRENGNSLIDRLYQREMDESMQTPDPDATQLDKVIWLLMRNEVLALLDFKMRRIATGADHLARTRLDEVMEAWQEIFPDNRILIEGGTMLFANRLSDASSAADSYSALRLSTGERAVIYYLAAIGFAPEGSVVFVDSPEIFLHPTIMQSVWNRIEMMRPDCKFVYTTHDLAFAATRTGASVVWVRSYDARNGSWDYSVMPPDTPITDDIYSAVLGARKPVIFIEGDSSNSIDMKLYSLIFKDYTIRPLGSCNKVIEATRAFNDLSRFHQLDSYGIVDRDRRQPAEVDYLRRRRVMVPEVAEVENILMLEDVIRSVARHSGKNEDRVFSHVRKALIAQFEGDIHRQALQHARYRVKRLMEYKVDGRFSSIGMFEDHVSRLLDEVNPRRIYDEIVREFKKLRKSGDYEGILRVYNQKSMLSSCNVAGLCGMANKEEYVAAILEILRGDSADADRIATAIRHCFRIEDGEEK